MTRFPAPPFVRVGVMLATSALTLAACGGVNDDAPTPTRPLASAEGMRSVAVIDSVLPDVTEAVGTATPLLSSTISTKLMAAVTDVHVREGDVVREGQLLVTLDVRDIDAKATQAEGNLQSAQAMLADAEVQTARMRSLFADSAAP
ncbi:MAG: biotin/lipoyl-binding protein, partial [Gemmatimonadaceae bacterium]|nr:biotin/lipoyl-binding protein [Gemmatimonadaceae bacterium]